VPVLPGLGSRLVECEGLASRTKKDLKVTDEQVPTRWMAFAADQTSGL